MKNHIGKEKDNDKHDCFLLYWHLQAVDAKKWAVTDFQPTGEKTNNETNAYRTEIFILQLLEFRVCVFSTQLHIAKHDLKHSVVNGLSEVHMELIHCSLGKEKHKQCNFIVLSKLEMI